MYFAEQGLNKGLSVVQKMHVRYDSLKVNLCGIKYPPPPGFSVW